MKKLAYCCFIAVFLPFILMVCPQASEALSTPADHNGNAPSSPYSIVAGSGSDPFILPNDAGGNPVETNFQRIKHPVTEWKFVSYECDEKDTRLHPDGLIQKEILIIADILNANCILRL